ncbi:hypothetical protein BDFB_015141 [Asbolus verrucosus]|uniref:DDE 3 domain containing protein n=1 Tax=Asbolus verrucosus TaxID=1661398 RepID=A0A482VU82_ASBVE|nr:hypothetical protein BDFB_015141 [Asbolus verrucosus]
MTKRMKRLNKRPHNRAELIEFVQTAWESVNEDYLFNLCSSIPNRLREVLDKNDSLRY